MLLSFGMLAKLLIIAEYEADNLNTILGLRIYIYIYIYIYVRHA